MSDPKVAEGTIPSQHTPRLERTRVLQRQDTKEVGLDSKEVDLDSKEVDLDTKEVDLDIKEVVLEANSPWLL